MEILNLTNDEASDRNILFSISKVINLIEEINNYFQVNEPDYIEHCQNWMGNILFFLGKSVELDRKWGEVICYLDENMTSYLYSSVKIIDANFEKNQLSFFEKN